MQKAVLLLGPRQVGKTTLLRQIMEDNPDSLFLDCDEPDIRKQLTEASSTILKAIIGNKKLVIIDEAQRVKNIGLTLKLIVDYMKDIRLIVSGSSVLELNSDISEPMSGRKIEIKLFGFSTEELIKHNSELEEKRLLSRRLVYGNYPEVVMKNEHSESILQELMNSYLYKDIFQFQEIRKPELLPNLIEVLARQVGNEVSYNELSGLLRSDPETISRYIDLLEKCFVIFRLRSFSRNLRNELKKSRKIYFYDNGIRNAILGDFRSMELRTDQGALWENFIISERLKFNIYNQYNVNSYFWRTQQHQEIDLIEDCNGIISAYELKYSPTAKAKFSSSFISTYNPEKFEKISTDNYINFLLNSN